MEINNSDPPKDQTQEVSQNDQPMEETGNSQSEPQVESKSVTNTQPQTENGEKTQQIQMVIQDEKQIDSTMKNDESVQSNQVDQKAPIFTQIGQQFEKSKEEAKQPQGEQVKVQPSNKKQPLVLIILGMAGTGKTTFVEQLAKYLVEQGKTTYNINLDPAVLNVKFAANIDIRDSVKYKAVMKQYMLGPNGAILTSLNIFAAQFDQVINLIEEKQETIDYVIIDTPGQIEAFSQSASGQIITESLGCTFPTISVYVADTVRCENPNTFMSNMLYSLSILYKTKLPLLILFNKIDVLDHSVAQKWMEDFNEFDAALSQVDNYLSSLSRSMSIVLEEFYANILSYGVSALTKKGFGPKLLEKFDEARKEYDEIFLPEIQQKLKERLDSVPKI